MEIKVHVVLEEEGYHLVDESVLPVLLLHVLAILGLGLGGRSLNICLVLFHFVVIEFNFLFVEVESIKDI